MNFVSRMRTVAIATCVLALLGVSGRAMADAGNYWQWVNPLPQGNMLNAVAWNGRNTYVAVGFAGTILTSPDAQTWTVRIPSTKNEFLTVGWGGTTFVAADNVGKIWTSPDGMTWTSHSTGSYYTAASIAWSGSKFVAVGGGGLILTSPDGATWTTQVAGASGQSSLDRVIWNGAQFVAVGGSGAILTSADGVTWAARSSGTTTGLTDVAWNGSEYVAVGSGLSVTSPDGVTWTTHTQSNLYLNRVAWGNGEFFAVTNNSYATSPDGVTWTNSYTGPRRQFYGLLWDGSEFLAVGDGGSIYRTADGSSWTAETRDILASLNEYSPDLTSVAWDGTDFVIVSSWGAVLTGADGLNWTVTKLGTTHNLRGVVCANGLCVAVGANGDIESSPDGVTWTAQTSGTTNVLNAVTWDGTQYVAVGSGGTILTSPAGVIWTPRKSGTSADLYAVSFGGGRLVAVGKNYTILASPDGVTWTSQNAGTTSGIGWFMAVAYGASKFVVTTLSNGVLASPDGVIWNSDSTLWFHSVSRVGSRFMASGYTNSVTDTTVFTSSDGLSWSPQISRISNAANVNAVAWNQSLQASVYVGVTPDSGIIASIAPTPGGLQAITATQPNPVTANFTLNGTGTLTVTAASSDQTLLPDANITGASSCTAAGSCSLTLQPAADQTGNVTVTVTVMDSYGQSGSGTFQVTVNPPAAPTATGFTNVAITQPSSGGEAFTVSGAGALTVTTISSDQTLLPDANITGASSCTTAGSCSLSLQAAADQTGTATVTVTVTDSYGQTATGTFPVTVSAPAAPTESGFSNLSISGSGSGSEPFTIAGTGTLTVAAHSGNQILLPDSGISGASGCTVAGSCTLTLQPAANQSGTATVMVSVTDAYMQSATGSFDVTVQASSGGGGTSGSGGGGRLGVWALLGLLLLALIPWFCRGRRIDRIFAGRQVIGGRHYLLIAIVGTLVCLSGLASAKPIGPRVPVTKSGKAINYDWKGVCPDENLVGVPAYPGSLCTKAAMFNKSAGFVELITGASAAAVVSWYSGHLSGWGHKKDMLGEVIFVPPGVDLNRVYPGYTDVNITIEKLSAGKVKIKKMIYAFKGTPKTLITIYYDVKGGKK